MPNWIKITTLEQIPVGESREFTVNGRILALYNVDGDLRAIDGICAHAGGPLGDGVLDGCIVTCPWHGWQYDVNNGEMCLNSQIRQESFPVRIESDTVYVELP